MPAVEANKYPMLSSNVEPFSGNGGTGQAIATLDGVHITCLLVQEVTIAEGETVKLLFAGSGEEDITV